MQNQKKQVYLQRNQKKGNTMILIKNKSRQRTSLDNETKEMQRDNRRILQMSKQQIKKNDNNNNQKTFLIMEIEELAQLEENL